MIQSLQKSRNSARKISLRLVKRSAQIGNQIPQISATSLRLYDNNNKRFFDFAEFAPLGASFAEGVAKTFIFYSSTVALDTAQSAYGAVLNFFRWLAANRSKLPQLTFDLKNQYEKATVTDWENAIAYWRDDLIAENRIGPVRKRNLISAIQTFFKSLIHRAVVPKIYFARIPADLRMSARPTRCLAEAVERDTHNKQLKTVNKHLANSKSSGARLESKRDFLTVLLQERGSIAGTEQEHAKELMKVNSERLSLLRNCAVEDFQKWHSHWLKGQELLQKCDLAFDEINSVIEQRNQGIIRNQAELFPPDNHELSLSRLLGYIHKHPKYQGQMIRNDLCRQDSLFSKQVVRSGGVETVQAYLFPHPELIVAAVTIFLCDTGANVSVGWSLSYDCLADSNDPGYKTIKGVKMRAGGKLIVNELPVKDRTTELSCVQALEIYRKISKPIRNLAEPKIAESLFLYIGWSGNVQKIINAWWVKNFRSFVDRHPKISHLKINSKMIRPSVLMQVTYAENSGIAAAGVLADHKSLKTTDSYVTARYPLQIIWERMIREFQSLFQITAIQSIEGAAEKLGLTDEQVSTLLREANRTGLGVACLDPLTGVQPNTRKDETCTELQNCPNCPQRFVVATVENLKDLILWNHHLEKQRDQWERERPERWEKVWLPWLAFTQVAIESASRGRTLPEYTKAKAIAKALIVANEINFPPLW